MVPQRQPSREVQSLDRVRRTPAKAQLQSPSPSNRLDADRLSRLGRVVKSALTSAHGSGQAAAIEIGMDQSQMNRQFHLGTFDLRSLASAGDTALALVGEFLLQEFGAARKTKAQIAREVLPQLLALMLDAVSEQEAK